MLTVDFRYPLPMILQHRPCHGFRRHLDELANVLEIAVFVSESNVK